MIKNSPGGLHTLCDRCRKILATDFNYITDHIDWEVVVSARKGSEGHNKRLDFCDERCRIVYLRGRKYYARKLQHIENNWNKEVRQMEGN